MVDIASNKRLLNKNPKLRAFGGDTRGLITYIVSMALFVFGLIFTINSHARRYDRFVGILWYSTGAAMLIICHVTLVLRLLGLHVPWHIDLYIIFATFGHWSGHMFNWYNQGWHWDKILHTAAGVFFTLIGFSLFPVFAGNTRVITKRKINPVVIIIFAIAFTLATAMLWEVLEFLLDSITGHNSQRWWDELPRVFNPYALPGTLEYYSHQAYLRYGHFQGSGLWDTMMDMIWHGIGAAPAALGIGLWLKYRTTDLSVYMMKEKTLLKELSNLEGDSVAQELESSLKSGGCDHDTSLEKEVSSARTGSEPTAVAQVQDAIIAE